MVDNSVDKKGVARPKYPSGFLLVAYRTCQHVESNSLAYWIQGFGWKRKQLMLLSIYGDYGEETCWVTAVGYV